MSPADPPQAGTPIDFARLRNMVDAQYDARAGTFRFDPAPFGSPAIGGLLAGVAAPAGWTLTAVAAAPRADEETGTVTVAGRCEAFYGVAGAPLTLVFFVDGSGAAQLAVKLELGAGWSFTAAFPQLRGTLFDEVGIQPGTAPLYVFASAPFADPALESGVFAAGTSFYGSVAPAAASRAFGALARVLGGFAHTTAVGPLSVAWGVPRFALALGVRQSLAACFPTLANQLEIQLVCELSELGNRVGLRLGTRFDFGDSRGLTLSTLVTSAPAGVLSLAGEFEGVELPSPTRFADGIAGLIGANDLHASLPEGYQDGGRLFLRRLAVGIGTSNVQPVLVSLEVGTPPDGPGWALGDFATVTRATFLVSVQNPFDASTRTLAVAVGGELDLPTAGGPVALQVNGSARFPAGQPGQYQLQAGLAPGATLPIPAGHLVSRYLPTAADLPDLTLGQLGVDFRFQHPRNRYGLYAGLDPRHPLVFAFGGASVFTVRYAAFHVENDGDGPGGGLAGGIRIFGVDTDFAWESGGPFRVAAVIPDFTVDLVELADGLLDTPLDPPGWLPAIHFPQTSLFFARQGSGAGAAYAFALQARPSFGSVVVQVVKQDAGWTLAAALELDTPRIAAFGALDALAGMDALFAVQELLFVLATRDLPGGFHFPPGSDFPGGTGTGVQLPSWAGPVRAGFYFYGSMAFNLVQRPNLALVSRMFGLDAELAFQLFVFIGRHPTQDASARASFSGTLGGSTTFRGVLGARMEAGEPQFYLEGTVSTRIVGSGGPHDLASCDQPDPDDCLTAAVVFELTGNAAFLSASMLGSVTFGPVTLSNLVVVVGVDFEGVPSLGFAAEIDLTLYRATYDSSLAFFFDSGDPARSLFAGSISDVTLREVVDTLVGELAGGDQPPAWLDELLARVGVSGTGTFRLPAAAAAALDARDFAAIGAAFDRATGSTGYAFSRQSTLLVGGDRLQRPGAWYLTDFPAGGQITHYQLARGADGGVTVSLEPQFYYCLPPGGGSVTLGPPGAGLVFGPGVYLAGTLDFFMLHLRARVEIHPGQGIAVDVEVVDPIRILSGYLQLRGGQDPTRGPRLSLSTFPVTRADPAGGAPVTLPPHFYLDGTVALLGVEAAATVNVSAAGLLVDLELHTGDASLGAGLVVKATLDGSSGFAFEIAAGVHIDQPHFELWHTDLGTLKLQLDIGATLEFGAGAGDLYLRLNDTHFSFAGTGFTIPGMELDVKTQQLNDLPGIILDQVKELLWEFLRDAEHWLEWLGKGLITGAAEVEQVLENVYNAVSSVWGNEKLVVASVAESLVQSRSVAITVTPAQPGGGITQPMIDAAREWAEQTAERLVSQAIIDRIRTSSPDEVARFRVDVLQDIDESYRLDQNVVWLAQAQGTLAPLTAQGFADPFADRRFYSRTQARRSFAVSVAVDADFGVVRKVAVAVRYNGAQLGQAYLFTSGAAHPFKADWAAAAGLNFQVQYTVTYQDPAVPQLHSGWLDQWGTELLLPVPLPAPA